MTAASAEQLYKWVDDQGHVHYTQTPPPSAGTRAKSVNIEVPRADATAAAAAAAAAASPPGKDQAPPAVTNDIAREAAIREKVDADEAPQRQKDAQLQYCKGLQSQLNSAQHANDNLSQSQRGARKLTDDAAQQKKIDALKAQIVQHC